MTAKPHNRWYRKSLSCCRYGHYWKRDVALSCDFNYYHTLTMLICEADGNLPRLRCGPGCRADNCRCYATILATCVFVTFNHSIHANIFIMQRMSFTTRASPMHASSHRGLAFPLDFSGFQALVPHRTGTSVTVI